MGNRSAIRARAGAATGRCGMRRESGGGGRRARRSRDRCVSGRGGGSGGGAVLADLAIGVSAVVADVVRSSRYVGSSAPVSVSLDVAEDGVLASVRGPRARTAPLDNPGAPPGRVSAA